MCGDNLYYLITAVHLQWVFNIRGATQYRPVCRSTAIATYLIWSMNMLQGSLARALTTWTSKIRPEDTHGRSGHCAARSSTSQRSDRSILGTLSYLLDSYHFRLRISAWSWGLSIQVDASRSNRQHGEVVPSTVSYSLAESTFLFWQNTRIIDRRRLTFL